MWLDLHNHSCLSPCGSLRQSPRVLVERARLRGLKLLALSDHNTGENLPAFADCCAAASIAPVFGIEVSSAEEVHVLCLFGDLDVALTFGREIYTALQSMKNIPEKLGDQVIVDAEENILGFLEKHLSSGAVTYNLDQLAQMVQEREGLFIPAHIDRPAFSIQSQLGFLPSLAVGDFDALEVLQCPCPLNTAGYFEITGSDAHFPENVGQRACELPLREASFAVLKEFLASQRRVRR